MNEQTLDPKRAPPPELPRMGDGLAPVLNLLMSRIPSDTYRELMDTMPDLTGANVSCGVTMLWGLSYATPEQQVAKILKERSSTDKSIREAFVIFSDIATAKGGNALYKYIVDKKLGTIQEFGPQMNPNSGNQIKLWVWMPPHESFEPKDRLMPVYGKILVNGVNGLAYRPDPRFADSRAREA